MVCDSRAPVSRFFQVRLVARERTVKVVLLRVVRDSAIEPRYPIKVTLLNISLCDLKHPLAATANGCFPKGLPAISAGAF